MLTQWLGGGGGADHKLHKKSDFWGFVQFLHVEFVQNFNLLNIRASEGRRDLILGSTWPQYASLYWHLKPLWERHRAICELDRALWKPDRVLWEPDRTIQDPDRAFWEPDRTISDMIVPSESLIRPRWPPQAMWEPGKDIWKPAIRLLDGPIRLGDAVSGLPSQKGFSPE